MALSIGVSSDIVADVDRNSGTDTTCPSSHVQLNVLLTLSSCLYSLFVWRTCPTIKDYFFETLRPSAGNSRPISEWQPIHGITEKQEIQGNCHKIRVSITTNDTNDGEHSPISPRNCVFICRVGSVTRQIKQHLRED